MRIHISQIYIEAGIDFPFSHHFQNFIADELSKRVSPSDVFAHSYGEDFDLIFRVSSKSAINAVEIKGPTVFRRDKDVEYTIFLPYSRVVKQDQAALKRVIRTLIESICAVLLDMRIDVVQIEHDLNEIIDSVVCSPKMFR